MILPQQTFVFVGPVHYKSTLLMGRLVTASTIIDHRFEQHTFRRSGEQCVFARFTSSTLHIFKLLYRCLKNFYFAIQRHIEEEVTFEALKKVLAEPAESRREAEYEKRQMICEKFRNTPFQQLVANSSSKVEI